MIKINLLPVRAAKKKETTRQQVSIFIMTIVGSVMICLTLYTMVLAKIGAAKDEAEKTGQQIQQLKSKIGEIENIKKLQADVKNKLEVLNKLRKEKAGPVTRLAILTDAVPDKLWLTKYSETAGTIALSGYSTSEDNIAIFMTSLQKMPEFTNVELLVSEQAEVAKTKVKKFDISMKLAGFTPPETKKASKK